MLLDLLRDAFGAQGDGDVANPTPSSPLSGLDVVATPQARPVTRPTAYDNSPEVAAIQDVFDKYPQSKPHSNLGIANMLDKNSTNPGHGLNLHNILNTLSDAFLVQGGGRPVNREQEQRDQQAQSMAGFQDNPRIAASRLIGTATPGSLEAGLKLNEDEDKSDIAKQNAEYLNEYRKNNLNARTDALITRRTPQWGQILSGADTKDKYKKAYELVTGALQRLKPDSTPEDELGALSPDDWRPGAMDHFGATTAQVMRDNRADTGQQLTYGASEDRTDVYRNSSKRPTAASMLKDLMDKKARGEELNPYEQDYLIRGTRPPPVKRGANIPGLNPGGKPAPSAADIAYVRAHPNQRAAFQAHFGVAP